MKIIKLSISILAFLSLTFLFFRYFDIYNNDQEGFMSSSLLNSTIVPSFGCVAISLSCFLNVNTKLCRAFNFLLILVSTTLISIGLLYTGFSAGSFSMAVAIGQSEWVRSWGDLMHPIVLLFLAPVPCILIFIQFCEFSAVDHGGLDRDL